MTSWDSKEMLWSPTQITTLSKWLNGEFPLSAPRIIVRAKSKALVQQIDALLPTCISFRLKCCVTAVGTSSFLNRKFISQCLAARTVGVTNKTFEVLPVRLTSSSAMRNMFPVVNFLTLFAEVAAE
eukprot:GDKJ01043097.1.p2 GENE.GDKJ01043097.1~~GDKJ01043097.1.p2  ORF type:complete len:126 (-),score=7.14 GDKJ01043097.1:43-420(-)